MKVGDTVIISHEIMNEEFLFNGGGVRRMKEYAGEVTTLVKQDYGPYWFVDVDNQEWMWHEDMLIPVPEPLE
ncbi:MAG: hypothetical protein ACRC91_02405 [Aeromonas sp.]